MSALMKDYFEDIKTTIIKRLAEMESLFKLYPQEISKMYEISKEDYFDVKLGRASNEIYLMIAEKMKLLDYKENSKKTVKNSDGTILSPEDRENCLGNNETNNKCGVCEYFTDCYPEYYQNRHYISPTSFLRRINEGRGIVR